MTKYDENMPLGERILKRIERWIKGLLWPRKPDSNPTKPVDKRGGEGPWR